MMPAIRPSGPDIKQSMIDALTRKSQHKILIKIASASHSNALHLSEILFTSLNNTYNKPNKKPIHHVTLPKSIIQSSSCTNLKHFHFCPTQRKLYQTLSSLTKAGLGGSQASSKLCQLETQHRTRDTAVNNILNAPLIFFHTTPLLHLISFSSLL